jgi:hypothetical protein
MLKERLCQALLDQARIGSPTTYVELATRLGFEPPKSLTERGGESPHN